MPKIADRVKETTSTTGSGTVTLAGAVAGYRAFTTAFTTGTVVYYCITSGTAWEVGWGTFTTSGTTLSRNLLSSSTGSLLVLSGTSEVMCTAAAEFLDGNRLDTSSAASYTPDFTMYNGMSWTVTQNITLNNPSIVKKSGSWYIDLTINSTGGYTLTFGNQYNKVYGYNFDCLPNAVYRLWITVRTATVFDVSIERLL
jgi:hypothetical protein